jgi:plasmid stabilization system protein ParE
MIIWSDEAKKTYEAIIDDLLEKWPVNAALELDFERQTNTLIDNLKGNNHFCPPIKYKQL